MNHRVCLLICGTLLLSGALAIPVENKAQDDSVLKIFETTDTENVQASPSCYYKHVSGCGGRCDSRSIYQCGGKEPANRVMGYDRWHNRYQSWELCRDLIVPDPDGMSQAEAKQCMSARCTNLAEFTLDKSNYGVNMAGPAQDTCPGTVTAAPTGYPTEHPSYAPTGGHPTNAPTDQPTTLPSAPPTRSPTVPPTAPPTRSPTVLPTRSPTPSPTYNPSAAAVQAASCYYKHVSGCGGRCDSRSIYQCGGKEPANRVMGYDRWHNRYQSWELCRDLIVPDPDGMSQVEAKQCMSARCTNFAEFTLDKSNYGVNMAGPAQDACTGL